MSGISSTEILSAGSSCGGNPQTVTADAHFGAVETGDSHGVTSNTAGLRYSGESGCLNESISDIFGSMVEFFANNRQRPG